MKTTSITLDVAIKEAIGLDGVDNPEYLRGMCELIARCFPMGADDTGERAEEIERLIRQPVTTQKRN